MLGVAGCLWLVVTGMVGYVVAQEVVGRRLFADQLVIPEPFIEIPVELASEMGVSGAEKIKVTSARGTYIAKAFVTKRIKPMMVDGKKVYQIGIPIHQGFRGIQEDADRNARTPANLLSPTVIDPNAYTPEFKSFLVKVEKA